jgi:hypothetical protein
LRAAIAAELFGPSIVLLSPQADNAPRPAIETMESSWRTFMVGLREGPCGEK